MNESNSITQTTALFGFISERAQQNRFSVTLNKLFKAKQADAMMIPMNIREDDLYFTVSNMRQSHLKGAYVAPEYRGELAELLDDTLENDLKAFHDFVFVKDQKLVGMSILPKAIAAYCKGLHVTRVAIVGSGELAMALAKSLQGLHVSFFDPYIEDLMQLSLTLSLEIDINRLAEGMAMDLSAYELLIDTSQLEDFSMITEFPTQVLQLENSSSNLKALSQDAYSGYEIFLPHLCETTYENVMKELV